MATVPGTVVEIRSAPKLYSLGWRVYVECGYDFDAAVSAMETAILSDEALTAEAVSFAAREMVRLACRNDRRHVTGAKSSSIPSPGVSGEALEKREHFESFRIHGVDYEYSKEYERFLLSELPYQCGKLRDATVPVLRAVEDGYGADARKSRHRARYYRGIRKFMETQPEGTTVGDAVSEEVWLEKFSGIGDAKKDAS